MIKENLERKCCTPSEAITQNNPRMGLFYDKKIPSERIYLMYVKAEVINEVIERAPYRNPINGTEYHGRALSPFRFPDGDLLKVRHTITPRCGSYIVSLIYLRRRN